MPPGEVVDAAAGAVVVAGAVAVVDLLVALAAATETRVVGGSEDLSSTTVAGLEVSVVVEVGIGATFSWLAAHRY
jgi:hypothetical protein